MNTIVHATLSLNVTCLDTSSKIRAIKDLRSATDTMGLKTCKEVTETCMRGRTLDVRITALQLARLLAKPAGNENMWGATINYVENEAPTGLLDVTQKERGM